MTTSNSCGDCDLCCRLLAIEALEKPPGLLCSHFHGGCSIYEDRPDACRGFHCLWLKSERLTPQARMGPHWRPDRAKFMMYTERGGLRQTVVVDQAYPLAWKREPYYGYLKRLSLRATEGYELLVYVGDRRFVIFPDEDVDLGLVGPQHEVVFGQTERDGRQVPCARIVDALSGDAPPPP
jgi:hypothetical protein